MSRFPPAVHTVSRDGHTLDPARSLLVEVPASARVFLRIPSGTTRGQSRFANSLSGVAVTIERLAEEGAAGISIEGYDPGAGIDPIPVAVARSHLPTTVHSQLRVARSSHRGPRTTQQPCSWPTIIGRPSGDDDSFPSRQGLWRAS
jgi:hypothetical protein